MIRMPHLSWRQRAVALVVAIVIAVVGGATMPKADASILLPQHHLTGTGIAVCVRGEHPVSSATWTFFTHDVPQGVTITSVEFSRAVHASDFAGSTIHAYTEEPLGITAVLSARATFSNGVTTPWYEASVWMDPGLCGPPVTTAPATTVPVTTEPPTTPAPTEPPTTVGSTTSSSICVTPVTLEDGSQVCNDDYGAPPQQPPTNPPAPKLVTKTPQQLPPTGAGLVVICVIVGLALCLVGVLARRADRARRRQRRTLQHQ